MWEYLNDQLKAVMRYLKLNKQSVPSYVSEEDVINDILVYLLEHPKDAKSIYENKNFSYLVVLAKAKIFEYTSKQYFNGDSKHMYSFYLKMQKVCDAYGVELTRENAYKIAGIMNDRQFYSITNVINFLDSVAKLERVPFSALEQELVEDNYEF